MCSLLPPLIFWGRGGPPLSLAEGCCRPAWSDSEASITLHRQPPPLFPPPFPSLPRRVSYPLYFSECQPTSCTYDEIDVPNPVTLITVCLGIIGGLKTTLAFFSDIVFKVRCTCTYDAVPCQALSGLVSALHLSESRRYTRVRVL